MEVYAIGSEVELGGTAAKVVGIAIYGYGVEYRVAWWDGHVRHVEWVSACEIRHEPDQKLKIGFKTA